MDSNLARSIANCDEEDRATTGHGDSFTLRDWTLESGHASSHGGDTPADWPIGCAIEKLRYSTATITRGMLPMGLAETDAR